MPLAKRIIPCLLHDGKGNVVKPISFNRPSRLVGSLQSQVEIYARRCPDELAIIDCEASREARKDDFKWLGHYVAQLSIPLIVGGSIIDVDGAKAAIDNGADAVVLRSVATLPDYPKRIGAISTLLGSASTIFHLCIKEHSANPDYSKLKDVLTTLEKCGIGEIIITDCERDGTMMGPNLELIKYVSEKTTLPVVASGGIGTPYDMHCCFNAGCDAVMAGSLFLYTDTTPRKCAKYLEGKGWGVRIE